MKKTQAIRILLSGGGTGGHLSPIVALIKHFQNSRSNVALYFVGSSQGLEAKIIPELGIPFFPIIASKFRRYLAFENLIDLFRIPFSFWQTVKIFCQIKPDVIFTSGGYITFPIVICSWIFRKPLIIHEQTLKASLVNKIAGIIAKKIAISFEQSKNYFPKEKCVLVGNPIRQELLEQIAVIESEFSFSNKLPVLYVTGSYQGSHFINQIIGNHLPKFLKFMNIIHQCGDNKENKDFEWLSRRYAGIQDFKLKGQYKLFKTVGVRQLREIYQYSDLVLSRAGASTISEIAVLKKPTVLIPYPYSASQEQLEMALWLRKNNAAEIFLQEEIKKNENKFVDEVIVLISNTKKLKSLASQIYKISLPNAVFKVAELLTSEEI